MYSKKISLSTPIIKDAARLDLNIKATDKALNFLNLFLSKLINSDRSTCDAIPLSKMYKRKALGMSCNRIFKAIEKQYFDVVQLDSRSFVDYDTAELITYKPYFSAKQGICKHYRLKPKYQDISRLDTIVVQLDKSRRKCTKHAYYDNVLANLNLVTLDFDGKSIDEFLDSKFDAPTVLQDEIEKITVLDRATAPNYFKIINDPRANDKENIFDVLSPGNELVAYKHKHKTRYYVLDTSIKDFALARLEVRKNAHRFQLQAIQNKDFYIKPSDVSNRVHTNVSELSNEYFEYLRLDGCKLVSFDVANSQPLLLSTLIGKAIDGKKIKLEYFDTFANVVNEVLSRKGHTNYNKYHRVCATGKLYESMSQCNRDAAKVALLESIFSSFKRYTTNNIFQNHYPIVFEIIEQFKKALYAQVYKPLYQKNKSKFLKNHKGNPSKVASNQVAIFLQKYEAQLFVSRIFPRLKKLDIPFLSKHDSIIVKVTDSKAAHRLINNVLKRNIGKFVLKKEIQGEKEQPLPTVEPQPIIEPQPINYANSNYPNSQCNEVEQPLPTIEPKKSKGFLLDFLDSISGEYSHHYRWLFYDWFTDTKGTATHGNLMPLFLKWLAIEKKDTNQYFNELAEIVGRPIEPDFIDYFLYINGTPKHINGLLSSYNDWTFIRIDNAELDTSYLDVVGMRQVNGVLRVSLRSVINNLTATEFKILYKSGYMRKLEVNERLHQIGNHPMHHFLQSCFLLYNSDNNIELSYEAKREFANLYPSGCDVRGSSMGALLDYIYNTIDSILDAMESKTIQNRKKELLELLNNAAENMK